MKKIILALVLLVAGSTFGFAQCDKKLSLSSSKTQHLDGNGAIRQTVDEQTTIEISKTDVSVTIINDSRTEKLAGPIKSNTCDWKTPFKEGKSVINATLSGEGDGSKDFIITIEAKDGKVTLLAESKDMPDEKIKLDIEKFEEKM